MEEVMVSYSILKFDSFPAKSEFKVPILQTLQMDFGEYTELTTEFKYSHDVKEFEKYNVKHFHPVKFTGTPYSRGELIEEVTELWTFDAYIQHKLRILLMKCPKAVTKKSIERINKEKPQFQIKWQQLDLKNLIKKFTTIYGAYFRDIQIRNVKSSAIHGRDVDKSKLFEYFESIGSISHFRTNVNLEGIEYQVGISRDYRITFYSRCSETQELIAIPFLKEKLDEGILKSEIAENSVKNEENLEDDIQIILSDTES